jgi:phosphatidate cytidylyltransferase
VSADNELGRRWAVAIVGVPIVLALLHTGGWLLALPVAVLAGLGAMETYRLAEQKGGTRPFRWLGATAAGGLVLLAEAYPSFTVFAPWALTVGVAVAFFALFGAIVLGPDRRPLTSVAVTLFGAFYVGFPLAFVPMLHELPSIDAWGDVIPITGVGLLVVTLPLASTWIGDSVAFFTGMAWGRAKILPSISPKKSWLGSIAGLIGAAAGAALWYLVAEPYLAGVPIRSVAAAAGVGAVLGVGAQIGDFAESLLKREAGVKDSGTIFPGHGGVLDRIDALIVTLPAAYAILLLLAGTQ